MAVEVLTNAKVVLGAWDLSGTSNRVRLGTSVQEKDVTTFGSGGWEEVAGGLTKVVAAVAGFAHYGTGLNDESLFGNLTVDAVPLTVSPRGGAHGELAYAFQSVQGSYESMGDVGEVVPFSADAWGKGVAFRGSVLHDLLTARTASGSGTGLQLGAVGANQRLYAVLHVVSASGTTPSITVKVQSDDNSGFTTPTDRVTFTAATATGHQWAVPVLGPVTDAWWRVVWTVSGTTPSFTFLAVVGIQ